MISGGLSFYNKVKRLWKSRNSLYKLFIKRNIRKSEAQESSFMTSDYIETIKHSLYSRDGNLNYSCNFSYYCNNEDTKHPSNIICRAYEILYYQYGVRNIKFSRYYLNDLRKAGYFTDGMRSVLQYLVVHGLPEKLFYTNHTHTEAYGNMLLNAHKHKILEFYRIYGVGDNTDAKVIPNVKCTVKKQIEDCISRQIPVICLLKIYPEIQNVRYRRSKHVVYTGSSNSDKEPTLCGCVIVGYNKTNNTILIDMGWGKWFGNNGTIRMRYDDFYNDAKELWYFKSTAMLEEVFSGPRTFKKDMMVVIGAYTVLIVSILTLLYLFS